MTNRFKLALVRVFAAAVTLACLPAAIYAWTEMPDSLLRSLLVATGIPLAVAGFILYRGGWGVLTDERPAPATDPGPDAAQQAEPYQRRLGLTRSLRAIATMWLVLLVPLYWKTAEVRTSPPTLVWLWMALVTSIPILLAESVRTSRSDDH